MEQVQPTRHGPRKLQAIRLTATHDSDLLFDRDSNAWRAKGPSHHKRQRSHPGGGVARNHDIELGHAGDEVRCLSSIVYMRAATANANNDWQGNCGELLLVNFSGGGSAQGIAARAQVRNVCAA